MALTTTGSKILKIGALTGTVGATAYYGVWGDTDNGVKAYKALEKDVSRVLEKTQGQNSTTSLVSNYDTVLPLPTVEGYNRTVKKTFNYLNSIGKD